MAMFSGVPLVKLRVLELSVRSVPLSVGETPADVVPVAMFTLALVLIAALVVITPVFVLPKLMVPPLTYASSALLIPTGPPVVSVAVPRFMPTPLVRGASVTLLAAGAVTEAPMLMLSPLSVIVPLLDVVITLVK